MTCLIELIYASGLRVSEVLSLPKSVARAKEPFVAVRGKGGKERLAPCRARRAPRWRPIERCSTKLCRDL